MIITLDMLKSKGIFAGGIATFLHHCPDGKEDYQTILDKYAALGHDEDANWLLQNIGHTSDVLELSLIHI